MINDRAPAIHCYFDHDIWSKRCYAGSVMAVRNNYWNEPQNISELIETLKGLQHDTDECTLETLHGMIRSAVTYLRMQPKNNGIFYLLHACNILLDSLRAVQKDYYMVIDPHIFRKAKNVLMSYIDARGFQWLLSKANELIAEEQSDPHQATEPQFNLQLAIDLACKNPHKLKSDDLKRVCRDEKITRVCAGIAERVKNDTYRHRII